MVPFRLYWIHFNFYIKVTFKVITVASNYRFFLLFYNIKFINCTFVSFSDSLLKAKAISAVKMAWVCADGCIDAMMDTFHTWYMDISYGEKEPCCFWWWPEFMSGQQRSKTKSSVNRISQCRKRGYFLHPACGCTTVRKWTLLFW